MTQDEMKTLEDNVRECLRALKQQELFHREAREKLLSEHCVALESLIFEEGKPCCRYADHVAREFTITRFRIYLEWMLAREEEGQS